MENPKIETRIYEGTEIRMADVESRIVEGYGIVFNKESRLLGGWFVEEIRPAAVTRAMENQDIKVTMNHNFDKLLGRGASNTATFTTDEIGVKYRVQIPNTTYGNDVIEMVQRGDITGSSFMFMMGTGGDEWETITRDGNIIQKRYINEIAAIEEMGPVTNEAYPDTTVAKRSFEARTTETEKTNTKTTPISIYERELDLL